MFCALRITEQHFVFVRAKPDTLEALRILYLFVTWPLLSSYEKPLVMTCSKQFMMLPSFVFVFVFVFVFFFLECEVNVNLGSQMCGNCCS